MSKIPKGGWRLQTDSLSKLIVWFKDGNIRTLYSIDWRNRHGLRDREIGLRRLRKKIFEYGIKAKISIIYDVQTRDLLERYVDGVETIIKRNLKGHELKKILQEQYQNQIYRLEPEQPGPSAPDAGRGQVQKLEEKSEP